MLIQNGADVNAVDECKGTALRDAYTPFYYEKMTALTYAGWGGHAHCALQLLCFGARIDKKTIEEDISL